MDYDVSMTPSDLLQCRISYLQKHRKVATEVRLNPADIEVLAAALGAVMSDRLYGMKLIADGEMLPGRPLLTYSRIDS